MMSLSNDRPDIVIIYDGECPFCTTYVKMLRLKQSAGIMLLVNAREGGPYVEVVKELGLKLDEGMALLYGGQWYHGADCLNVLALMTSSNGVFNAITAWAFKSSRRAKMLYPWLRCGRNITLRLLGRRKIEE